MALSDFPNYTMHQSSLPAKKLGKSALNKQHIASRFSKASEHYYTLACIQKRIAQDALQNVPSNQHRVLDIGCASGEHTRQLGKSVVGVDLAFGMINQAKNNPNFTNNDEENYNNANINSHWVNADMDALPFTNGSFSHVFSSMAMQWSRSPKQVMSEIKRVLAPKGGCTLVIPVKGAFWQLKQAYAEAHLESKIIPLNNANHWLNEAQELGFNVNDSHVLTYVDTHCSLLNVLRSISKVGASSCVSTIGSDDDSNKSANKSAIKSANRSLTKTDLAKLSDCYPKTDEKKQTKFNLDYQCLLMNLQS